MRYEELLNHLRRMESTLEELPSHMITERDTRVLDCVQSLMELLQLPNQLEI